MFTEFARAPHVGAPTRDNLYGIRAGAPTPSLPFPFFVFLDVFGADGFAFFVDFVSALETIFRLRYGLAVRDLDMIEEGDDGPLDGFDHFLEHFIGFEFVFDERILLPVSPQVDAFLEGIHSVEVVHPLAVDDAEHNGLFQFLPQT